MDDYTDNDAEIERDFERRVSPLTEKLADIEAELTDANETLCAAQLMVEEITARRDDVKREISTIETIRSQGMRIAEDTAARFPEVSRIRQL